MINHVMPVILVAMLMTLVAVVGLDAWQYEYFGNCDGCIVLDTLRPGLDR